MAEKFKIFIENLEEEKFLMISWHMQSTVDIAVLSSNIIFGFPSPVV